MTIPRPPAAPLPSIASTYVPRTRWARPEPAVGPDQPIAGRPIPRLSITVATDGSGEPDQGGYGRGGYGWVSSIGGQGSGPASESSFGAELRAIAKALEAHALYERITVFCDCKEALQAIRMYQSGERRNAWVKRGADAEMAYIDAFMSERTVVFVRVKGHSGDPLNERADRLARQARKAAAQR